MSHAAADSPSLSVGWGVQKLHIVDCELNIDKLVIDGGRCAGEHDRARFTGEILMKH